MTKLYTLPTCPICEMVKTKLNQKQIPYIEVPFEELPSELGVDRAPVLEAETNISGTFNYLITPTDIIDWIKGA